MFNKLSRALELAIAGGADQAEVFSNKSISTRANVRDQEIEELKRAEDSGFAVRVLKNKCLGFAFSSELNEKSIAKAVGQALDSAKFTTPDEHNTLFVKNNEPAISDNALQIHDPKIAELSLEEKISFAKRIETAARQVQKIAKTESVSYSDHIYEVFLANSSGFQGNYKGTYCGGTAEVIAEDKGASSESGFGVDFKTNIFDLDLEQIGLEAAQQAAQMLNAATIDTQSLEIVFPPLVAIDLLDVVAPMLCADHVLKGKSLLINKENTAIASELISIIDNGLLFRAAGSAPFDAEGTPQQKKLLVEQGVLRGFLHNNYTASRTSSASTGNASRGGFMSPPEVSTSNIYFEPGLTPPQEIIRNISKGFYVTRLMGLHTANPISGDFSLGASGLLIENGKLGRPVRGVAIAGNILQLLANTRTVGNDLRFVLGAGAPTIHLGALSVSGS
jgi:PmbA protein